MMPSRYRMVMEAFSLGKSISVINHILFLNNHVPTTCFALIYMVPFTCISLLFPSHQNSIKDQTLKNLLKNKGSSNSYAKAAWALHVFFDLIVLYLHVNGVVWWFREMGFIISTFKMVKSASYRNINAKNISESLRGNYGWRIGSGSYGNGWLIPKGKLNRLGWSNPRLEKKIVFVLPNTNHSLIADNYTEMVTYQWPFFICTQSSCILQDHSLI